MTGTLTYHAAQARINELLRDAADRQRVHAAAARRHSPRRKCSAYRGSAWPNYDGP